MKIVNLLILAVFSSFCVFAQDKTTGLTVEVTADHPDWVYQRGENANFTIQVREDGEPVEDVLVKYQIGLERMTPSVEDSVQLSAGVHQIDGGTLNEPGFLRCIATVERDGKVYRGLATAAFEPEAIKPTTTMPEDFEVFWDSLKMEAKKIPLNPNVRLLEDKSTDDVDAYEVSIQNIDRTLIYAAVAVPKKKGKYPGILMVPGAGVRPYNPDVSTAAKGFIVVKMGIHGIPVTMAQENYTELAKGDLYGYPTFNSNDRDKYYFKRVIIGCIRALDYLTSLPEYDGETLGVTGGSQGGALTIITAALDKRVKYLASYFPGLCDLTGPLHDRTGGWPHTLEKETPTPELIQTTRYYDVVNFAKLLTIPGMYTWGYNDETCPPTSISAAYNSITAPKDVFIIKEAGHAYFPQQRKIMNNWFQGKLKTSHYTSNIN